MDQKIIASTSSNILQAKYIAEQKYGRRIHLTGSLEGTASEVVRSIGLLGVIDKTILNLPQIRKSILMPLLDGYSVAFKIPQEDSQIAYLYYLHWFDFDARSTRLERIHHKVYVELMDIESKSERQLGHVRVSNLIQNGKKLNSGMRSLKIIFEAFGHVF
ncbi:hypothetical protein [Deinococcus sp.]|uniref:hypothetical protein n=1 Tax=Deinococcus sp. TaxID=47478 RepID=UPI003C7B1B7D